MRFRVYPYKQGSRSAKMLATAIGGKVLKREGSNYAPKHEDVVINWGSSSVPCLYPALVWNAKIDHAQNKLKAFQVLKDAGVSVPPYWTEKENVPDDVYPVLCRTILNGHSGNGIVIAHSSDELVDAPLYTQYIKKQHEYRIHVANMQDGWSPFFLQRKAKKSGIETPNWMIRNLAGGFAFVEVLEAPEAVIEQSIMAMQALDLDFGGVDVIWNEHHQKAYVLEVNTACGLEQRTADKYAEMFKNNS